MAIGVVLNINNKLQFLEINKIPEVSSSIDALMKEGVFENHVKVVDLLRYPMKKNIQKLFDLKKDLFDKAPEEKANKIWSVLKAALYVSFIALGIFVTVALFSISNNPFSLLLAPLWTLLTGYLIAKALTKKIEVTHSNYNTLLRPFFLIHHEFTIVSKLKSEFNNLRTEIESVFNDALKEIKLISDNDSEFMRSSRKIYNKEPNILPNMDQFDDELVQRASVKKGFDALMEIFKFYKTFI